MSLYRNYSRAVKQQTGYQATWFPHVELHVGDIGVIEGDQFTVVTSLTHLGISFGVRTTENPAGAFDVSTQGVRDVVFKAKGELDDRFEFVAQADAGIKVDFDGRSAAIVKTKGVRSHFVDNLAAIEARILELVKTPDATDGSPTWKHDWVLVSEVVEAKAATVLASTSSGSSVEISASGDIGPDGLVDADAGLTVKSSVSSVATMLAKRNATPFYKGRRVRHTWFWLWGLEVAPADEEPPADAASLFEDAEDSEDADDARDAEDDTEQEPDDADDALA